MAKGTARRVLCAMTTHPRSTRVQQDAAGALSNITLREEYRAAIAESGTVRIVVGAMRQHMEEVEVLWRTVGVLLNLSLSPQQRQGIMSEGAVPAILACQRAFMLDERLQWRALGACGAVTTTSCMACPTLHAGTEQSFVCKFH